MDIIVHIEFKQKEYEAVFYEMMQHNEYNNKDNQFEKVADYLLYLLKKEKLIMRGPIITSSLPESSVSITS
jgi:hypothetical protein